MAQALALFLCAVAAVAQAPDSAAKGSEAAPPEVDAALRARIKQFYQAHVDAKFRQADQVVAEDSKDIFFAASKPKYHSFEIVRINYHDNFTTADSVVACKSDWFFHGEKRVVTLMSTSTWKVIDGQWFWYVVPVTKIATPFGKMDFDSKTGAAPAPGAVPALPADPAVLAKQILSQVQADKTAVVLSSYEPSSAEVRIKNGMPGVITLRADIDGAFPGLTYKLDKTQLGNGETAVLTLTCTPKDRVAKPSLTARITVEPTGKVIPIEMTFAIPPEIEKLIPKEARRPANP